MNSALNDQSLDQIFRSARTPKGGADRPVEDGVAPNMAEVTAMRDRTLQGAYLIVAARALGLDCGPMSGFDNTGVDKVFFSGTRIRSNFICSIGYGDPASVFPRNPRLSFEEAGRWA